MKDKCHNKRNLQEHAAYLWMESCSLRARGSYRLQVILQSLDSLCLTLFLLTQHLAVPAAVDGFHKCTESD